MKQKRKNQGITAVKKFKLPLILAIVFTSILALSIIVLSILQTNTKPNLPNPDEIKIYKQSTTAAATYKKGTDDYNEIMNLYNSMFEKTYLDQLADNSILQNELTEDIYAPLWADANKETGLYIELIFSTPKKFIVYRNKNSRRVDVSSIVLKLSNENDSQPLYIYYTIKDANKSNSNDKDKEVVETEPNYPIVTQANTYDLYKHLISK